MVQVYSSIQTLVWAHILYLNVLQSQFSSAVTVSSEIFCLNYLLWQEVFWLKVQMPSVRSVTQCVWWVHEGKIEERQKTSVESQRFVIISVCWTSFLFRSQKEQKSEIKKLVMLSGSQSCKFWIVNAPNITWGKASNITSNPLALKK